MSLRAWMPLALMTTLIIALGAYATVRQDAFLTKYNLGNLLLTAMPLAPVARDLVAAPRDAHGPHDPDRVRDLLGAGVDRGLLPRLRGADRLADHRQLRAREHRRGCARWGESRGRQRLVRRHPPRGALPHGDRQRPAPLPAADRVRVDD